MAPGCGPQAVTGYLRDSTPHVGLRRVWDRVPDGRGLLSPSGSGPPHTPHPGSPSGDWDGPPPLSHATEWIERSIQGNFGGQTREGMEITGCQVIGSTFTSAVLERARITDSVFRGCDLSGTILRGASFVRVEFVGCRMLGVTIPDGSFHDVRVTDCQMKMAVLRMARGARIAFDRCDLREADFYAARIDGLRLFDCDLTGAEFSQAALAGARLHGSRFDELKGAAYLRGVVIDSAQIVPMALQMFYGMGVKVDDERDPSGRA